VQLFFWGAAGRPPRCTRRRAATPPAPRFARAPPPGVGGRRGRPRRQPDPTARLSLSLFSRAPPPGASRSCSRTWGTRRRSGQSPCPSVGKRAGGEGVGDRSRKKESGRRRHPISPHPSASLTPGRRPGRTGRTGRSTRTRPCPRTRSTRPRGTSTAGRCRPPRRRPGCRRRLGGTRWGGGVGRGGVVERADAVARPDSGRRARGGREGGPAPALSPHADATTRTRRSGGGRRAPRRVRRARRGCEAGCPAPRGWRWRRPPRPGRPRDGGHTRPRAPGGKKGGRRRPLRPAAAAKARRPTSQPPIPPHPALPTPSPLSTHQRTR